MCLLHFKNAMLYLVLIDTVIASQEEMHNYTLKSTNARVAFQITILSWDSEKQKQSIKWINEINY